MKQQQYYKDIEQETITRLAKQVAKQVAVSIIHMLPILRYVSIVDRKKGKSPFNGCTSGNVGRTAIKKDNEASVSTLKETVTFTTRKVHQLKVSKPPLSWFMF